MGTHRWVHIQGILEIGLKVRCDAIKRLELQTMQAGKSKLQLIVVHVETGAYSSIQL